MHCAAVSNNTFIISVLARYNANLNLRDNVTSPLTCNIEKTVSNVMFIICHEQSGRTPLHIAVKHGALSAIQALSDNGAEVNITDHVSGLYFCISFS